MATKSKLSLDVVDARSQCVDPDRLSRVKKTIEDDVKAGRYDGAVFLVGRGGKVVAHEAVGLSDLEKKRATQHDDIFFLMSITKSFTAVRALMAVERGDFDLTTPVAEVIPEFGIKGKHLITLKHLLTHTSGMNSEIPAFFPVEQLANIEGLVAALSRDRLFSLPGQDVTYNATTAHAVIAVMIQRLDEKDRPFRTMLEEDLFLPLGMNDTALGLPDRMRPRLVPLVVRDRTDSLFEPELLEAINYIAQEDTEFPSGGGVSTVADVYRFAEMLRRGGELDGKRVLSPGIIDIATTNQTGDSSNHVFDCLRAVHNWPVYPAYLGMGFFLRGEGIFPAPMGHATSPRTFAGLGAGSTMFWVDPERDLTFVFLSAGLMEEGNNFLRLQRLSDLVVASVVE